MPFFPSRLRQGTRVGLVGRVRATTGVAATIVSAAANAQFSCPEPAWQPFGQSTSSFPGMDNVVSASAMWDPDGAGPKEAKLVLGGEFLVAGDAVVNHITAFDLKTKTFTAFGTGLQRYEPGSLPIVRCIESLTDGDLVVGGTFFYAGGGICPNIAQWDHTLHAWKSLGLGIDGIVHDIAQLPDGDLVVAGNMIAAGGYKAAALARWNQASQTWTPFGNILDGTANNCVLLSNGDLCATGLIYLEGVTPPMVVGRWSGTQWTVLADYDDLSAGGIDDIAELENGDLIAVGTFTQLGNSGWKVAKWDLASGTWTNVGAGITQYDSVVHAVLPLSADSFVVGGTFSIAKGAQADRICLWDGSSWTSLGQGVGVSGSAEYVQTITKISDNDLAVGGYLLKASGIDTKNLAQWTFDGGGSWSNPVSGWKGVVRVLRSLANGNLIAGGDFASIGNVEAKRIARWNATTETWSPVGGGTDGTFVLALAEFSNGDIVAGGDFVAAGGTTVNRIARWNGSAWLGFGSGMDKTVRSVLVSPAEEIIAGGDFMLAGGVSTNAIARWNGTAWSPYGTGITGGGVRALLLMPNGDLIAGGTFTKAGTVTTKSIARWNGTAWSALGSGMANNSEAGVVYDLVLRPSGEIVAAGDFQSAGGKIVNNIASWNGSVWTSLAGGVDGVGAFDLLALSNGDLLVGGQFDAAGGTPMPRIARWDGTTWHPLGDGVISGVFVRALASLGDDEVAVGGDFIAAGAVVAPGIARYGCPPIECYADCDASGTLDIDDFICFQTRYALNDPLADCDTSGGLDIDDFICFQTLYAIGC